MHSRQKYKFGAAPFRIKKEWTGKSEHILVIDDDRMTRRMLARALGEAGYRLREVGQRDRSARIPPCRGARAPPPRSRHAAARWRRGVETIALGPGRGHRAIAGHHADRSRRRGERSALPGGGGERFRDQADQPPGPAGADRNATAPAIDAPAIAGTKRRAGSLAHESANAISPPPGSPSNRSFRKSRRPCPAGKWRRLIARSSRWAAISMAGCG